MHVLFQFSHTKISMTLVRTMVTMLTLFFFFLLCIILIYSSDNKSSYTLRASSSSSSSSTCVSSVNGFIQFFPKHLQRGVHGIPFLKQPQRPLQSDLQPHLVSSITAWGAGRDRHLTGNIRCVCSLVFTPAILFDGRKIWAAGGIGFVTHGHEVLRE